MAAIALVAIISFDSAGTHAQSQNCATQLFRFCDDCDTIITISVQTGHVCMIPYQTAGKNPGGIDAIFRQKVIVRPRGGIYGVADETSGAYKANDGFAGSDSFQVDIEYERLGHRFVTHLKATVNVHP